MISPPRSLSFALAAVLLSLMLPELAVAVPAQLNHQGRLLDAAGVPVEGELEVTFTLEDTDGGGSVVWSQTLDVEFRDGYYSVRLGGDENNTIDAEVLGEQALWIGVSIEGAEPLQPLQKVVSAPYAVLSDSAVNVRGGLVEASEVVVGGGVVIDTAGNWVGGGDFATEDHAHGEAGVPLGTIIDWWRPSPDVALPEGYQVCDGGTVDDVASPWFGYPLPDLIGRVALGVSEEEIGLVGGNSEHSHGVEAAAHDHPIDHEHGVNTGETQEVGPLVTEPQIAAMTVSGGAVSTGAADNTTVTSNSGVTGGSNTTVSGTGGASLTSASTAPITSTVAASSTGSPSTSFTSSQVGSTGVSTAPTTSSSGTAATDSASPGVTSGGFGTTSQSTSNTGSTGNHNHKTFRWDNGNRRWKDYSSTGSERLMLDYSWNEGTGTTLLESQFALGLPVTTGSQTSYTDMNGSHSHSNSHSHSAGTHGHSMPHTHDGPAHTHQNEHNHSVDGHNHTMVHQHGLVAHDHDSDHMHMGSSHDHSIAHDHNISSHDHELPHSHIGGEHQHDSTHQHEIDEHSHQAGDLAAPPFVGASASGGSSGSVTSSLDGGLPPYVGLLKLMRVR